MPLCSICPGMPRLRFTVCFRPVIVATTTLLWLLAATADSAPVPLLLLGQACPASGALTDLHTWIGTHTPSHYATAACPASRLPTSPATAKLPSRLAQSFATRVSRPSRRLVSCRFATRRCTPGALLVCGADCFVQTDRCGLLHANTPAFS